MVAEVSSFNCLKKVANRRLIYLLDIPQIAFQSTLRFIKFSLFTLWLVHEKDQTVKHWLVFKPFEFFLLGLLPFTSYKIVLKIAKESGGSYDRLDQIGVQKVGNLDHRGASFKLTLFLNQLSYRLQLVLILNNFQSTTRIISFIQVLYKCIDLLSFQGRLVNYEWWMSCLF